MIIRKYHFCKICHKTFFFYSDLQNHINQVHEGHKQDKNKENQNTKIIYERQRNYMCDICDQLYSRIYSLKRHMKKVHKIFGQAEWEYICVGKYTENIQSMKTTFLIKVSERL